MKTAYSSTAFGWSDLIKMTLPIAMGYYAAGIAYGILGVSAGLPLWLVVGLSIFVYSGAAQYAAIPLFASAAGFFPLVIGTLLISLRQIFYTLALHSDLPKKGWQRWYSTASITDESYALISTQPKAERAALTTRINFLCQFYWVSSSLIGALLGAELAGAIPHLEFALPCLFIILAYEQYRQVRQIFPLLLAVLAFVLAKLFAADWLMLGAILFCILVILARYNLNLQRQIKGETHE
ncbi:AzlC family ABC transporter permease [Testudinibacter sp. P27/CKL/0425]